MEKLSSIILQRLHAQPLPETATIFAFLFRQHAATLGTPALYRDLSGRVNLQERYKVISQIMQVFGFTLYRSPSSEREDNRKQTELLTGLLTKPCAADSYINWHQLELNPHENIFHPPELEAPDLRPCALRSLGYALTDLTTALSAFFNTNAWSLLHIKRRDRDMPCSGSALFFNHIHDCIYGQVPSPLQGLKDLELADYSKLQAHLFHLFRTLTAVNEYNELASSSSFFMEHYGNFHRKLYTDQGIPDIRIIETHREYIQEMTAWATWFLRLHLDYLTSRLEASQAVRGFLVDFAQDPLKAMKEITALSSKERLAYQKRKAQETTTPEFKAPFAEVFIDHRTHGITTLQRILESEAAWKEDIRTLKFILNVVLDNCNQLLEWDRTITASRPMEKSSTSCGGGASAGAADEVAGAGAGKGVSLKLSADLFPDLPPKKAKDKTHTHEFYNNFKIHLDDFLHLFNNINENFIKEDLTTLMITGSLALEQLSQAVKEKLAPTSAPVTNHNLFEILKPVISSSKKPHTALLHIISYFHRAEMTARSIPSAKMVSCSENTIQHFLIQILDASLPRDQAELMIKMKEASHFLFTGILELLSYLCLPTPPFSPEDIEPTLSPVSDPSSPPHPLIVKLQETIGAHDHENLLFLFSRLNRELIRRFIGEQAHLGTAQAFWLSQIILEEAVSLFLSSRKLPSDLSSHDLTLHLIEAGIDLSMFSEEEKTLLQRGGKLLVDTRYTDTPIRSKAGKCIDHADRRKTFKPCESSSEEWAGSGSDPLEHHLQTLIALLKKLNTPEG